MRYSCLVPKATDTNSEYVTLIAFLRQQCLRELALILRYITLSVLYLKPGGRNM
jgi:hypothetical protein